MCDVSCCFSRFRGSVCDPFLSVHSLYPHLFSRAYINFKNPEDILLFRDRFDGYVFIDNKGKFQFVQSLQYVDNKYRHGRFYSAILNANKSVPLWLRQLYLQHLLPLLLSGSFYVIWAVLFNIYSGQEYPAVVEFAPFQKISKKKLKKKDAKAGSIEEGSNIYFECSAKMRNIPHSYSSLDSLLKLLQTQNTRGSWRISPVMRRSRWPTRRLCSER